MSYTIKVSSISSKPPQDNNKKITNIYWDDDTKEIVVEYKD